MCEHEHAQGVMVLRAGNPFARRGMHHPPIYISIYIFSPLARIYTHKA